jgi:hypothetical protein
MRHFIVNLGIYSAQCLSKCLRGIPQTARTIVGSVRTVGQSSVTNDFQADAQTGLRQAPNRQVAASIRMAAADSPVRLTPLADLLAISAAAVAAVGIAAAMVATLASVAMVAVRSSPPPPSTRS